ncbi:hypothetical protein D9619_006734 [Psilocybe cf. subviscida]|uniref:Fungal lipase-type domain-containing protein n=1 Tax=Psilocybe cf. subviscida TaxID=2480587 RepID=A0A8H5B4U8_9AGAR|nr:hypothetical protein D9619_006734 [Psilocybe cf. subviscida]
MVFAAGIFLAALACLSSVMGVPLEALEERATSTLSASTVSAYKPYTYYASTAHCKPANTLAWNCGANCNKNPVFKPIASGGDGAVTQFWYVGYDSTLQSVIVAFQGTDGSKIIPILTDLDFFLDELDGNLFPGVSPSIKTHNGFGEAQRRSASDVLAAVKQGFSTYSISKVTVVGHSLGGAIAIISSAHLKRSIPTATVKTITYGAPRVGNAAFANFANGLSDMVRINNKRDIVPIVPDRFLGFAHTEGEVHISSNDAWISCPGQDSTDAGCTIDTVPNILVGSPGDHSGPYDGVIMGC